MTGPFPASQPPYLERVGIEFDIAVNVATEGPLGWTVSERSAPDRAKRADAVVCRAKFDGVQWVAD